MKTSKGGWIARVILGAALGVLSSVVLASYLAESRGPTLAVSLLCTALGGVLGTATLPFADDGRSLLLRSAVHFGATALLFGLLMAQFGARGTELLAEAKCLKSGRTTCLYAVEVRDELGTYVAHATVNGFTVK